MENENKLLKDQLKEYQERVDKIRDAPKLLPKRDTGRIYEGTTDPEDHVTQYVTSMKGNDLAKEHVYFILLKKSGETLTGGALTWYSQLPARSIKTFEEMDEKFVMADARAKKAETRVNNIFIINQSIGEGLRDFIARFNRVKMTLPNISEEMAVAAFQNGLSREGLRATRKLLSQLMKYHLTTWDEIYNAYCAEVRADDDDFNRSTRWLISECGHRTEDCIALRQEFVDILKQGHLKELLSDKGKSTFARGRERQGLPKSRSWDRTINMLIGGNDDASFNGIKFIVSHKLKRSITHERYDRLEKSIIFEESDADDLTFPHNDALVITLRILDTDVKSIMADDESGVCIIHPQVFA
ncbi:uncharacterized protein [Nicotiana sylvestris]|uniref:Retrotransposon gag domain-containing protein n=2 Tax=Nicotiana TaxID=4085 RepID=A0A1S4DAG2_TOBAC|nr:PREDICTED: uncharacterized protein LOC104245032 [Nicotiana sylvestris]XP_016510376.1 PREDICTED: uncharacterized protein LOC107827703 [Nicotiana tabacum]